MTRKYPPGEYNPRAPRPQSRGPRPQVWVTGPDPVEHKKYRAFIQQKNQAQFREEGWTITFDEWKALWGDLWHQRGRARGDYCMTRIDRDQPWTTDNTHVITREEHARIQGSLAAAGYRSPAQVKYRERMGLPVEKQKTGPKGPHQPRRLE